MALIHSSTKPRAVFSLYRSFLRQVRQLPHYYLREFLRIKIGEDIRAITQPKHAEKVRLSKVKRVRKELQRLKHANEGHLKSLDHFLDLAYGRKGPLLWSILRPLLDDPHAPLPPRIISTVERSRPPQYSPELTALLSSELARSGGKPMKFPSHFVRPPTMPARENPDSEEARLFGPFSKRRKVNILWRYFTEQYKSVYPPLEVSVPTSKGQRGYEPSVTDAIDSPSIESTGIRSVGLQGSGILQELQALAGPSSRRPPTPRRQTKSALDPVDNTSSSVEAPTRFLRRRYRGLLARTPILTYTPSSATNQKGQYNVSIARTAMTQRNPIEVGLPSVDEIEKVWLQQYEGDPLKKEEKGERRQRANS